MIEAAPQAKEQRLANLEALHKQLGELAAKKKSSVPTAKQRPVVVEGPVLVVRGK
jgi:ABC-type Zn uptake system ZnuABC Zn-binding protein ZnuA